MSLELPVVKKSRCTLWKATRVNLRWAVMQCSVHQKGSQCFTSCKETMSKTRGEVALWVLCAKHKCSVGLKGRAGQHWAVGRVPCAGWERQSHGRGRQSHVLPSHYHSQWSFPPSQGGSGETEPGKEHFVCDSTSLAMQHLTTAVLIFSVLNHLGLGFPQFIAAWGSGPRCSSAAIS